VNDKGLVRWVFPSDPPFDTIVAAFTARNLRKDNLPSENLNTGLHTGDDPINVLENRKLVFGALNLEFDSFTAAQQVHGDNVVRVTENERGRGAHSYDDAIPATDALITDVPGIPIGVFTADCVPIFLFDPVTMAVGAVHAGWRSTAQSIARKTVAKMREEFDSNPADMWAAFGPSIGPCCYEVGRDVYEAFSEKGTVPDLRPRSAVESGLSPGLKNGGLSPIFRQTKADKWHLDLWLANKLQLEESGLSGEKIIETRIRRRPYPLGHCNKARMSMRLGTPINNPCSG